MNLFKFLADWKMGAFLILGLLVGLYSWHAYDVQRNVLKVTYEIEQKYTLQIVELKQAALKETSILKRTIEDNNKEKEDELQVVNTKYSNLLSELSKRPSRPSKSDLPGNPKDTESTEGTTAVRLFRDDASLLTRFSRDTAELQTHLNACYKDYDSVKANLDQFRITYGKN